MELDEFLATDPYATELRELEGGRVYEYVVTRDTPAPISIGLLIGDAAHNLRSALDHLALACSIRGADHALSEDEEKAIEYPICLSPADFGRAARRSLAHLEATPLEIIRRYQPYVLHSDNPKFAFSWRLARLDNIDKHRRIATTTYVVTIPVDGRSFVTDSPFPKVEIPHEGWGVGSVVARLTFAERRPRAPLIWDPKFSITIDGDGPGVTRPDEMLELCIDWMQTFIMEQTASWEAGYLTVPSPP
jgi:hypothetical protein